jgi:hypothetical protein
VRERIEHERVVGIRAVTDPDQLGHPRLPRSELSATAPAQGITRLAGTRSPPQGPEPEPAADRPSTELSTYPPSSTDRDPPRLMRVSVIVGAPARNRPARAQPTSPIHR